MRSGHPCAKSTTVKLNGLLKGYTVIVKSENNAENAILIREYANDTLSGRLDAPLALQGFFKATLIENGFFTHGTYENSGKLKAGLDEVIEEESKLRERNLDGYHRLPF